MAEGEEFEVGSSPINQLKKQLRELKGTAPPSEHLDNIHQRLANLEGNFNTLIDVLKQASQATDDEEEIKKKIEEVSEQNKVLIEAVNELLKLLTEIFKSRKQETGWTAGAEQQSSGISHPKLQQPSTPIVYQRTR